METFAIVTYVISSKILETLEISDDHQAQMTNAEIITFAIVAAKFFHCNFKFESGSTSDINVLWKEVQVTITTRMVDLL